MVHDRHPIAQLVGLLHVVGGEQDRLPLAVELPEDLPQRQAALRVEAGGRLVQEQHGGAVEDRARDHQPLGHPAGEREHRRLGPLGQLELLEQLVGGARDSRRGDAEQAAVEVEVLPHRQLAVQGVRLRDCPEQLLGQRRVGDNVDRAHVRRARGGHHPRGEHPRGRRLAGAVRPEQAEDLPAVHAQVEPVHGGEVGARVHLGQRHRADHLAAVHRAHCTGAVG